MTEAFLISSYLAK